MARTYRDSWASTWKRNLEDYETRARIWWRPAVFGSETPSVETTKEWYAFFRDGAIYESGRNQGYKDDTNKLIRRDNQRKIHRLMVDIEEYDDMVFSTKYDGKYIRWSYW